MIKLLPRLTLAVVVVVDVVVVAGLVVVAGSVAVAGSVVVTPSVVNPVQSSVQFSSVVNPKSTRSGVSSSDLRLPGETRG